MTKKVTITITGPANSGKTYLMEKIFDMMKVEGIDCSVDSPDDGFGIWQKWKESAEPIPTLKEVLVKCDVGISLVEKIEPMPLNLDLFQPQSSVLSEEEGWDIMRRKSLGNALKMMMRHRRLYTVMVDDALDLKDVADEFITEYASGGYPEVEFLLARGSFELPEYDTKPLVIIYPVTMQPNGLVVNRSIPTIINFLSTSSVWVKDDIRNMVYAMNRRKEIGVRITVKEWADDLNSTSFNKLSEDDLLKALTDKTPEVHDREFFNAWTNAESELLVELNPNLLDRDKEVRPTTLTVRRLLEIAPTHFDLYVDGVRYSFVKFMDDDDTYGTPNKVRLPKCFEYVGYVNLMRRGDSDKTYLFKLNVE